jgi:hypothetical protein
MAAHTTLSTLAVGARVNSTISIASGVLPGYAAKAVLTCLTGLAVTAPAGWDEDTAAVTNTPAGLDEHTYYRKIAAGDSSWTWTHLSSTTSVIIVYFSGRNTQSNPFQVVTPTGNTGTSAACRMLELTAPSGGYDLLFIGSPGSLTPGAATPPSGMTELLDWSNVVAIHQVNIQNNIASGATGDKDMSNTSQEWVSFGFLVAPQSILPNLRTGISMQQILRN